MIILNYRLVWGFLIGNYRIGMVGCALRAFPWSHFSLMVIWTVWTWSVLCGSLRMSSWSRLGIVNDLRVVSRSCMGSHGLDLVCWFQTLWLFLEVNLFFLQLRHLGLGSYFFTHFYFLYLLSRPCAFFSAKLNFAIRILVYYKVRVFGHYNFWMVNHVVLIKLGHLIWRNRMLLNWLTMICNQCIWRGSIWVNINARRGPENKMKLLLSRWVVDYFLIFRCLSHLI